MSEVRKKRLSELLNDNFIEFASNGLRYDKEEILKHLPEESDIE